MTLGLLRCQDKVGIFLEKVDVLVVCAGRIGDLIEGLEELDDLGVNLDPRGILRLVRV